MTSDLMSTAYSSVRAKMTEPSLGLIVIPVQAEAGGEQATKTEPTEMANSNVGRCMGEGPCLGGSDEKDLDAEGGRDVLPHRWPGGTASVSHTPSLEG